MNNAFNSDILKTIFLSLITISALTSVYYLNMDEEEQIIEPLKIKKLYNKSVKNLSGGELQKVAVTSCLLKKVDLYALDEPSAFLDVEDRIAVGKFLQKFVRSFGKSAIIIDHDLQLMDLVSDSMVIFEGTSGIEGHATQPIPKHTAIGLGMWLGIVMAFNVWFVIWPNQKRALGMVDCTPEVKAKSARTAMLFSRTNTLLSLPMLLTMVAAQNLY